MSFSPNGRYIASGSDDHSIIIWDAEAGVFQYRLLFDSAVDCILWHPVHSNTVIVGTHNGFLFQIHGFTLDHYEKHDIQVGGTRYTLLARMSLSTSDQYVGDIKIPRHFQDLGDSTQGADRRLLAVGLNFYKNGRNLIVSYLAHGVICWDISTCKPLWRIAPRKSIPICDGASALSTDAHHILVDNLVDGLQLYDVGQFKHQIPRRLYKLDTPRRSNHIVQIAFIHQDRAVISGSTTGNVCLWDTATAEFYQLLPHNEGIIQALAALGKNIHQDLESEDLSGSSSDEYAAISDAFHAIMSNRLFHPRDEIRRGIVISSTIIAVFSFIWASYYAGTHIPWNTVVNVILYLLEQSLSVLEHVAGVVVVLIEAGITRCINGFLLLFVATAFSNRNMSTAPYIEDAIQVCTQLLGALQQPCSETVPTREDSVGLPKTSGWPDVK
ncbi:Pre-mRNA-processing factor 17 [Grifola frondosa]|uniref:Pre-mRNA-processing factor 17 n=1 Tax=Grifola frondosa TaxID=5627 RepID=A0A1C7MJF9_GRIFR|nr:Pre-mRNA-processing factor 17 [Grifola frondosa]